MCYNRSCTIEEGVIQQEAICNKWLCRRLVNTNLLMKNESTIGSRPNLLMGFFHWTYGLWPMNYLEHNYKKQFNICKVHLRVRSIKPKGLTIRLLGNILKLMFQTPIMRADIILLGKNSIDSILGSIVQFSRCRDPNG